MPMPPQPPRRLWMPFSKSSLKFAANDVLSRAAREKRPTGAVDNKDLLGSTLATNTTPSADPIDVVSKDTNLLLLLAS